MIMLKIKPHTWYPTNLLLPEMGDYNVLVHFSDNHNTEMVHVEDYFGAVPNGTDAAGVPQYTCWYKTMNASHWQLPPPPPITGGGVIGVALMSTVDCPNCAAAVEINHDDGYGYEDDENHTQDCDKCGYELKYTTSISYDYSIECQDGDHVYERRSGPNFDLTCCIKCDYYRLSTDHDKATLKP